MQQNCTLEVYAQEFAMILTILSLIVGYLTLSVSTVLLYAAWLSGVSHEVTNQFLVFASICSLGFATLSGWLTGLIAQRAPIFHAGLLSGILIAAWGLSTLQESPTTSFSIALLNLAVGVTGIMTGGWWRFQQMKKQT